MEYKLNSTVSGPYARHFHVDKQGIAHDPAQKLRPKCPNPFVGENTHSRFGAVGG